LRKTIPRYENRPRGKREVSTGGMKWVSSRGVSRRAVARSWGFLVLANGLTAT